MIEALGPYCGQCFCRYSSSADPESSSVALFRRAKKISRALPFREENVGWVPRGTSMRAIVRPSMVQ